jgi:hypothetical protein
MSEPLPKSIRRILFALGEEGDVAGAFESAASLAQRLDAELHGLFIEDTDLLRLAGLPFARETGTTTAVVRRLQHPDIERGWQRQAARLQERLAEVAVRRQLRWSFEVVRGRMTAQVAELAVSSDVVAVTKVTRTTVETLQTLQCPVLILPAGAVLATPVGVLVDDSPASEAAVRFAGMLATGMNDDDRRIFVMTAGGLQEGAGKRAGKILADAGLRVRSITPVAADESALIRQVIASRIRTLVVAADVVARFSGLQSLLAKPPCALWLTR